MISTVPYMFERTLADHENKGAVYEDGRYVTFGQLHTQVLATAKVLQDLGIESGDRIGICMSKSTDQAIAILAVMYANAIFVPILPKLRESNIKHIIADCDMTALIVDASRAHEVVEHASGVDVFVGHGQLESDLPSLPELRDSLAEGPNVFNRIGSDIAAIIYTSGSTGRPKGIMVSHRNLFDGARIVSTYLGTTTEDRIAGVLTLEFDYGLNQLWQILYKGASLHLHKPVFPNDLFEMISSENITALHVMPVILTRIFDNRLYLPNASHDFSQLRYVSCSGGPVSEKMLDNVRRAFPKTDICLMFGLTEAFRCTYLPPHLVDSRPNSIGIPIPDVDIYVMDDDYSICPANVPGQMVHRGGCVTKGYWNDPHRTAEVFRQIPQFPGETVVFTGDIVTRDEEGFLYYIGRADSMIKSHGYRISPTEIEEEACKHPQISAAVAFGVINDEIGKDVVLAYTTTDHEPVCRKELVKYLKQALPWYMVPSQILHMEDFADTGNEGKIDRLAVQTYAEQELGLVISGTVR